jgi:hypothetical protein
LTCTQEAFPQVPSATPGILLVLGLLLGMTGIRRVVDISGQERES